MPKPPAIIANLPANAISFDLVWDNLVTVVPGYTFLGPKVGMNDADDVLLWRKPQMKVIGCLVVVFPRGISQPGSATKPLRHHSTSCGGHTDDFTDGKCTLPS